MKSTQWAGRGGRTRAEGAWPRAKSKAGSAHRTAEIHRLAASNKCVASSVLLLTVRPSMSAHPSKSELSYHVFP